jgi:hypothetical protein
MRLSRSLAVVVLLLMGCARPAAAQQLSTVVLESRAEEGESVLKQVSMLQQAYVADTGRFATTFDELQTVGWEYPPGLRFYQAPRIVRAQGEELCIVIEPTAAQPELWPQHVDSSGQVRRGPCPER